MEKKDEEEDAKMEEDERSQGQRGLFVNYQSIVCKLVQEMKKKMKKTTPRTK